MPIKPELKKLYPDNWKEISLRIREESGGNCQFCGRPAVENLCVSHGGLWYDREMQVWRDRFGNHYQGLVPVYTMREVDIVLTVAHLDQDPRNCRPENLRALCQYCHNRYDRPWRIHHQHYGYHFNQLPLTLFA